MIDRVAQNPGRMKETDENGNVRYVTLELADNPVTVGTTLNKANLLTDATAARLGLTSSATPNDAFGRVPTSFYQVIVADCTWTAPFDMNGLKVICIGGGGSGNYGTTSSFRATGGSSGVVAEATVNVASGTKVPVTIGNGGIEAAGGTTSFGTFLSAAGGAQGGNVSYSNRGTAGGGIDIYVGGQGGGGNEFGIGGPGGCGIANGGAGGTGGNGSGFGAGGGGGGVGHYAGTYIYQGSPGCGSSGAVILIYPGT